MFIHPICTGNQTQEESDFNQSLTNWSPGTPEC